MASWVEQTAGIPRRRHCDKANTTGRGARRLVRGIDWQSAYPKAQRPASRKTSWVFCVLRVEMTDTWGRGYIKRLGVVTSSLVIFALTDTASLRLGNPSKFWRTVTM